MNANRDKRLGYAMARAYGIRRSDWDDVAAAVIFACKYFPKGRRRMAAASTVVRRMLAKQMGLPSIALDGLRASVVMAIGDYELRGRPDGDPNEGLHSMGEEFGESSAAFSVLTREPTYHDRRFAQENGVCPRCAEATGKFGPDRGACACGFRYGSEEA
jgi:hypothetical protein